MQESMTSAPSKLYHQGDFRKFQQIMEVGLFFHFGGENLKVQPGIERGDEEERWLWL